MSTPTSAAASIWQTSAVLDADWGKTLHTGDEAFQGSADVSWSELDSQGTSSTWDNDSFKDQNATEAAPDYIGSLESPSATGVIGADGNTTSNSDSDITGTAFQETVRSLIRKHNTASRIHEN